MWARSERKNILALCETPAMSDVIALVTEFLGALQPTYVDLTGAIERYCTEDCVWSNTGLPTQEGKAAMLAFNEAFRSVSGLGMIEIDILNIAAEGNVVLTERIDYLRTDDGTLIGVAGHGDVRAARRADRRVARLLRPHPAPGQARLTVT
jgi:limonene-1,2-epoxide hydrolase